MPMGIKAAKVTPLQALKLGLSVDVDALDSATKDTLAQQLKTDPSGNSSALLNDPDVTAKLVNANAVIGMPIKDSNGDGVLEGAKCADRAGAELLTVHD